MYIAADQQFETAPIFPFVTYSSGGLSAFPSYLKLVLPACVKSGSRLLPTLKKSFALTALLERWRTSTAPSVFPVHVGDVSGKVWSTLITTQQKGIYPPKTCRSKTAKLLRQYIGASRYACIARVPIYLRFAC